MRDILIEQKTDGFRKTFYVLFSLWGGVGFFATAFFGVIAPALNAIFVALFWIGGLILFGLAGLLCEANFETRAIGEGRWQR